MRIILSDKNLIVQERVYEGFPLLIGRDGQAVEPAQTFLWDELASNGRTQSPLTWAKYGRDLYDYFAFMEANGLDWRSIPPRGMPTHLDRYRDWSRGQLQLHTRTINARLRLVARFYTWARSEGHIDKLPFSFRKVYVARDPGFFAHVQTQGVPAYALRAGFAQRGSLPAYLTMDQVLVCLQQLRNPTHRLMFELMVRCGLRQIECRTFPVKYICNPAKRADLHGRRTVSVSMNPDEMKLKYDKPRSIDLPVDLMDDLWWYVVRRRRARAEANGQTTPSETVFLTEQGRPYGSTALTDIFAGIAKRVGFYVRPHMLRHTYATYMLWRLRASNFKGDPLMYVRDRLGHSSVATTMVYLHLVNTLEAQLVLQHEDEIDALFHAEAIR